MRTYSSQLIFEDSINFGVTSPVTVDFSSGNIDVGTKIINVTDPTNPQDVATKAYVDSLKIVNIEDSSNNLVNSASGTGYFQWQNIIVANNTISAAAGNDLNISVASGQGVGIVADTVTITGNLTVNGTTVQVDAEIVTADAVIDMNDGEVGAGVTLGYSGLNIERGSSNNYWLGFDEVRDAFTVGEITALSAPQIATTQIVATRIDSPTDTYVAVWDAGNNRLNFVDPATVGGGGGSVNIGTSDQIPYVNSVNNNFEYYTGSFTFDNNSLLIAHSGIGGNKAVKLHDRASIVGAARLESYSGVGSSSPPQIVGSLYGSSSIDSLRLTGFIAHGNDTGTTPIVVIDTDKYDSATDISSRGLFAVRNNGTTVSLVNASGDWDYQDNKLTNIGALEVGASFPTTNPGAGKLWNDGGTIKMGT